MSDEPVLVLGCGLIGGSIAAGLSGSGMEVWGADRRDLAPLVERRWLARQVPAERVAEAAVVVLALPPSGVLGALARLPFQPGQVVTDTASVKAPVARAAARLPPGVAFVGGHPMAGGTGSGWEAARPDLFRGAAWALSPVDGPPPAPVPGGREGRGGGPDPEAARTQVEALVRRLGAEPVTVEPERHDRIVALTSHLPQLLAVALAAELDALDGAPAGSGSSEGSSAAEGPSPESSGGSGRPGADVAALLGPGGRGLLRLAESPYELWRDIVALNRDEIARALSAVAARAGLPPDALEEEFTRARETARRLGL
ncbi:MAG: prephenate dehydrogenase [Thermoanaerobaculia bacterium]